MHDKQYLSYSDANIYHDFTFEFKIRMGEPVDTSRLTSILIQVFNASTLGDKTNITASIYKGQITI